VMQLRNAEEYPTLCDVVGVTICNFNLWSDKDASGQFKVPMLSRWCMQEQHGGERGLSQVQYAFLELPKYAAGNAPQTLIEKWAYFFREAKNLTVVPAALAEGPFRDAMEVARATNFSSDEWQVYERAKMAEQDARGALTVIKQEGISEGIVTGKRDMLLLLIESRGIVLTEEERAKIATGADVALLEHWFVRSLTAKTAAEVFG
jgi:predicted transposase/invertase (TIGR01784 family)